MTKMCGERDEGAPKCAMTNRREVRLDPRPQCAKAQDNAFWDAGRAGREQDECRVLSIGNRKTADGSCRFTSGQFDDRHRKVVNRVYAVSEEGGRFGKLDDVANLARGQVLIEACSCRPNFPCC